MIKKIGHFIIAVMFIVGIQSTFFISKAYAQGSTKVVVSTDKSSYNVGDTVKVTVKAQNVVDLFGVQFTLHYDPSMLSMEGNDFTFSDGYTVFGGSTVDKEKGIITYPVINKNPSSDNKDSVTVGYANFKATKEGPITLNMDNIKSVNSQSVETNYNTQTQSVLNVAKAPSNPDGGNDDSGSNDENQGNNGSGNNGNGNAGQGSGNTNQPGNGNNNNGGSNGSSTGFNSDTSGGSNSINGSAGGNSNAEELTASAVNNVNQGSNGSTSTVSQSENGNSTNQNAASNGTKNSAEGSAQNSSANNNTKQQELDSKSNSNLNIVLLIVVIVLSIICAILAFLSRKTLKDTFSKITKRKN